ncbi:MAG: class I SAM-dependent methyltransferase [Actinomycetota bacterium]|nr:class I SAM-dependent methyltransferase [Actinomycetota bacterium]
MRVEERRYYARRAREYDDWYLGRGRYADRDRPGWEEEKTRLVNLLATFPPARVLDAACGTGFLTRHLRGDVTGIDQSPEMIEVAQGRCPDAAFVVGDALELPFGDGSFDLVLAAHFYGHLREPDRRRFLAEARRVAPALVVVDAALRPDVEPEVVEERILNDGSCHQVYKRFFDPAALAREVGGGDVLLAGSWFVAVAA